MALASLIFKLGADTGEFTKQVDGAKGYVDKFKTALGAIGITLGATAVIGFFKSVIEYGSKLTDVADKLGVTVEYLQKFRFAAEQAGINTTTADLALQRFTRRLGEAQAGGGELLPILKAYNIELFNADGSARRAEEVLKTLADTIAAAKTPMEALRIAFKAFDSEGAGLVTLLKLGGDEMTRMMERATELGLVISEDTARSLDRASDAFAILSTRTKTFGAQVVEVVLWIGSLTSKMGEAAEFFAGWWGDLISDDAAKFFAKIADVATFSPVGWLYEKLTDSAEVAAGMAGSLDKMAGSSAEVAENFGYTAEEIKAAEAGSKALASAAAKWADFLYDQLPIAEKIKKNQAELADLTEKLGDLELDNLTRANLSEEALKRALELKRLEIEAQKDLNDELDKAFEKIDKAYDLLQDQKEVEAEITALREAYRAAALADASFTFSDVSSGGFDNIPGGSIIKGSVAKLQDLDAAAEELRNRAIAASALGREYQERGGAGDQSLADRQFAESAKYIAQRNLTLAERRALQETIPGLSDSEKLADNPFKAALGDAEEKLGEIKEAIEKL